MGGRDCSEPLQLPELGTGAEAAAEWSATETDACLCQVLHQRFPLPPAVGSLSAAVGDASPFCDAVGVVNEYQSCGAVDADGVPSSGAVGVESGRPFLGVADATGGSPFCGAVGAGDENPSYGAADEALACSGWCGTALTGAGEEAGGTDQWESP